MIVILVSFFSTAICFATEPLSLLPRCGETDFGLCGYVDAKIWKNEGREVFVLEPLFERAGEFSDGLAAVRINGKFGYIDLSGKVVIRPKFSRASIFDQGLAVAGDAQQIGIIDRSGRYVVEPMFAQAVVLSDKVIIAQESRELANTGRLFSHNPISTPYIFEPLFDAGIYHLTEGWLTDRKYTFHRFDKVERDLIWAQVSSGRRAFFEDIYGLMRVDGTWLIEPGYSYAEELEDNLAPVRIMKNGKEYSGAIDSQGREVIPFVFDYLTHWKHGFLKAGKGDYPNRKFGIVNRKGDLIGGRYFDEIEDAYSLMGPDHPKKGYFTVKDGGEWKTLLQDGTLLPDQRVGDVFLECEQFSIFYGLAGYELKPTDATLPTIGFERPLFRYSNQKCDPPPTLIRGDTYGAILKNGSLFGGFFENSYGFFGKHRWVRVEEKWGLIDAGGVYAVAPVFDSVAKEKGFDASDDLPTYKVTIGKDEYRIRFENGKYEQEPYSVPEEDKRLGLNCKGGFKRKSNNGLWGIVDGNGDDIIAPKYRAISCFGSGVAWVPDDTKREWCPIDSDGRFRSAPPCMSRYHVVIISHHVPEKFHDDPYESNVLWVRAWLDYADGKRSEKPKMIRNGGWW